MRHFIATAIIATFLGPIIANAEPVDVEEKSAFRIAKLFYAARAAVGERTTFTDDPSSGKVDKAALFDSIRLSFDRLAGEKLNLSTDHRLARLWSAIEIVVDKAMKGDYKGNWADHPNFPGKLIPARFGSELVKEFNAIGGKAGIRWTTSDEYLVNLSNKADEWEQKAIREKFKSASWKQGAPYFETTPDGFRYALPEYFKTSCMNCHGGAMGKVIHKGKGAAGSGSFGGILSVYFKK